jgi:hypothetical protein
MNAIEVFKTFITISSILRLISAILLFAAVGKQPYSYYTALRFIVCFTALYCARFCWQNISDEPQEYIENDIAPQPTSEDGRQMWWMFVFLMIAVVFNPVIPLTFERSEWQLIDIGIGLLFIVSIYFVEDKKILRRKFAELESKD